MASAKEVRTQITSIQKTQKITKAMEMVAASKVRKAKQRMDTSRPYSKQILQVIEHLRGASTEYHHQYLVPRELKRVGLIVISTDRGLCGSLNTNLFKNVVAKLREWDAASVEVDFCLVGNKADRFFKRFGGNIVATGAHTGDMPSVADTFGIVKVMLELFENEKIDALYIAYNEFVTSMQQNPMIEQLLPIVTDEQEVEALPWDYIYEPDAKELLDFLLTRHVESQVYQAMVENIASEHASRMVSMKNATDNAGQLIDDLRLVYNKTRQASITKELSEIVAGAEAV